MTMAQLRIFLSGLVSDLTGKTTFWGKQNAPKVKKPYLVMRLFAMRRQGMDEILVTETPGELNVHGHREVTLELQWLGAGAIDGLAQLEQDLQRPTVVDRCAAAGVAIFDTAEIQDLTELVDATNWAERASLDCFVRFARATLDRPGIIENVIVNEAIEIGGDS